MSSKVSSVSYKTCIKCNAEDIETKFWIQDFGDYSNPRTFKYICDNCKTKNIKTEVAIFAGDTEYTEEVVCPHCGYTYVDSWEFCDSDPTIVCDNCENQFSMERNVEVTYSTTKL